MPEKIGKKASKYSISHSSATLCHFNEVLPWQVPPGRCLAGRLAPASHGHYHGQGATTCDLSGGMVYLLSAIRFLMFLVRFSLADSITEDSVYLSSLDSPVCWGSNCVPFSPRWYRSSLMGLHGQG